MGCENALCPGRHDCFIVKTANGPSGYEESRFHQIQASARLCDLTNSELRSQINDAELAEKVVKYLGRV